MALTPSTMLELGTRVPDFELPDPDGKMIGLDSFKEAPALVVMFICNHCPYVKHIRQGLAAFTQQYQDKGIAFVGINSNDVQNYPDDSPAKMAQEIKSAGYTFAYLFDEAQDVAKAFRAACTPEFYLFDKERRLVYRGEFDESRPGNSKPVSGKSLGDAIDALIAGRPISDRQNPSVGCNIKWKPGNAPNYSGH